jgi:FHA domain/Trypsin-like peptidase domain
MNLRIQSTDSSASPLLNFARPEVTIGRDEGCDLPLNGAANVSGQHARIVLTPTGGFLVDLHSTNGTFLNDRKIEGKEKLHKGDYIRLGHTGPSFRIVEVDLTNVQQAKANSKLLERRFEAGKVSAPEPGYPFGAKAADKNEAIPTPPLELPAPVGGMSSAPIGQTRLMVVSLQKNNRKLAICAGAAILGLLFVGGVTGLYFLWATHQQAVQQKEQIARQKAADAKIAETDEKMVKVADKLTRDEEDTIYSRFAESVYHVAIYPDDDHVIYGTAFAITKEGKLATNGHITYPAGEALKAGRKVEVISHGGKNVYAVVAAVSHPQYINWPGGLIQYQTPDVGILTVRLPVGEFLPKVTELATEEELRKLNPGAQLCYIGFPGWSDYASLKKVEPHIYKGGLTRLTTLKEESGEFSNLYLLQHDMASTGGASGSPIFNRDGKVVAIHNSGRTVSAAGPGGHITSIPSGPCNGIRIDLLKELLRENR